MNYKKIMIAAAAILTIGAATFASCNKETDSREETSNIGTPNKAAKPMSNALKAFLLKNGIEVKVGKTYSVLYRSGCYRMKSVLWGLYKSVSCEQGCDYCELLRVKEDGVSIKLDMAIKPDNNTGRYGLDVYSPTDDMHDGLIYLNEYAKEPRLYFLVDINKVTDKSLYDGEYLHLESPFAINYKLAIDTKISWKDQIIPAGDYKLEKFDDIVLWSIPLSQLLSDKEQEYFQELAEKEQNEND